MDGDVIGLILKDFGPAGGFAILLLAASMWANWKLDGRLNKNHEAMIALEKTHAEEMSGCRLNCEREKNQFRETLEKRYQEATTTFIARDDQKRQDITVLFARFENMMGIATDTISKSAQATQDMRYAIKDLTVNHQR